MQYTIKLIKFNILVEAQGPTKPGHRGASQCHHGVGTRVCFCKRHAIIMARQRLEQFPKTQMVSFNQDPCKPCILCMAFQKPHRQQCFSRIIESLSTRNQKLDADLVTNTHSSANPRFSMIQATDLAAAAALLSLASKGAQWDLHGLGLARRRAPGSRAVFSLLLQRTIRTVPWIALFYVLSGPSFQVLQDMYHQILQMESGNTLQVDSPASFTVRVCLKALPMREGCMELPNRQSMTHKNLPDDLGKGAATMLSKSSEENCQEMIVYSDRVKAIDTNVVG